MPKKSKKEIVKDKAEQELYEKDEEFEKELELYPDEEQGILPEEDADTVKAEMEHGEKDEDIYTAEGEEKLEEDDEIDLWEEGFMEGARGPGQLAKDALTGEPLMDVEDVIELEFEGEMYRFASEENASKFLEQRRKEKKKRSG